ncbi:hypothetical protein TNCV_1227781 [Trichonephila clavipes]|nr:hypothetical protein TNCV_1227781 [Trichonephila clavipes]
MVASIYIPPNPSYRNLSADLDTLFKIFFNTAIVAGDYNAKHTSWGCGSSDQSQTQRLPRKRKNPDSGAARVPPSSLHFPTLLRVVEFIKEGNNNDECGRGLP